MEKICELCKKTFECTEDSKCWCTKLAIMSVPKKIKDCVCEECLTNEAKELK